MSNSPDTSAKLAELGTRVDGLDKGFGELRGEMNNLRGEMSSGFSSLATKLDQRTHSDWKTVWPAIGIGVAILTAIGGLAYRPIDAAQAKIEAELKVLQLQIVPRGEHERNWRVFDRDMDRMEKRLDRVEAGAKP